MGLRDGEGTIGFRIFHDHPDWSTNRNNYDFRGSPMSQDGVFLVVRKHADGYLEVIAMDTTTTNATFKTPVPQVRANRVHVIVTWQKGTDTLYLQGQPVQVVELKTAKPRNLETERE
jgi:hypothetical protein